MTRFALMTILALAATPAQTEDQDLEEGIDLLTEGTKLLLRGLMTDMEPKLRELGDALTEFDGLLGDLGQYHPPEVLPNGDIILRRKTPRPLPPRGGTGEIEL